MVDGEVDPHQEATSVRRGVDAGLAFLHQKDATALSCAIANLEVLLGPLSVKQLSVEEAEDEEEDPSPTCNFDTSGFLLLVTKQAVLFWRINHSPDEDPNECDADLLIPGSCIDLQAITSSSGGDNDDDEPKATTTTTGVYLQVSTDDQGDCNNMLEINVQPDEAGGGFEICQEIYTAVAKLIELHPHAMAEEDEYYDDDGPADDDDDDEMIMASDFVVTSNTTTDTADEDNVREQMLERLSNLLIVPPEYEIAEDDVLAATEDDDGDDDSVVEGQFADAEDDNDPFL